MQNLTETPLENQNVVKKSKKTSTKPKKNENKTIDIEENKNIENDNIEKIVENDNIEKIVKFKDEVNDNTEKNKDELNEDNNILIESDENNNENLSDVPIYSSQEEYFEKLDNIIELLKWLKPKSLKDYELTKDFVNESTKKLNKVIELTSSISINRNNESSKIMNTSSKKKLSKKDKKNSIPNPNHAVNKKCNTFKELLEFMNLPEDTLISKADIQRAICSYVSENKLNVETEKRKFKLDGKLKTLFNFIRLKMIEKEILKEEDDFPTQIYFTNIMGYLKYCFV
jgi:hypothetical protein